MSIDLYKGHRTHFLKCYFFSQEENEDYVRNNQIVYKKNYTGDFYAREVNGHSYDPQSISDSLMYSSEQLVIETNDDVSLMSINDKVKIEDDNKFYIVLSIQKTFNNGQRQYRREKISCTTTITLKR